MNYESILLEYLSHCNGKILDVFFELYDIISSTDKENQPAALKYVCENAFSTESDHSHIAKVHYSKDQFVKSEKIVEKRFRLMLGDKINRYSKEKISPMEFYASVWNDIQSSQLKTKRDKAFALFVLVDHELIPYRAVGVGLSMNDDDFKSNMQTLRDTIIDDTDYILNLCYEEKTQQSSLIVDKLRSLKTREEQAVYLSYLMFKIEENWKNRIKSLLDD